MEINKKKEGYELNLNTYEIDDDYNITTPNSTWFLLRKEFMDERMNEYNIKEGDILRIGRILVRIKTIKFAKNNQNKNKANDNNKSVNTNFSQELKEITSPIKTKKIKESKDSTQTKLCRICYGEEETQDNPLVQPCICSGSMKYIHLNCLKTWINTSVNIKLESTEYCNVYTYKPAECELCKTTFPDFIRHKGKLYEILDFYNDFNSFLIFECITQDKSQSKYIYVVNLDIPNNRINIGRGHNSNVLLNDISKIIISDNNSKFGTLILVQTKDIKLSPELMLYLQIGRTYLKIQSKKPYSLFGCCGVSEKKDSDYYYLQNSDKHKFQNKLTVKTEIDNTIDGDIEEKNHEIKEDNKDIDLLKTKVNLMDDNDLEGLLLTSPFETNGGNNQNDFIEKESKKDLIDKDNDVKIEKNDKDKDSSIVINDDDKSNGENNNIR